MNKCKCGCGQEVSKEGNVYLSGHYIRTTQIRKKMSDSHKDQFVSEETRIKMSEAGKGKIISIEAREKQRKTNTKDIKDCGYGAIHNRAAKLRKEHCEICGMTNEESLIRRNKRLSMHCRDADNYTDLSDNNWMTVCEYGCHQKMDRMDRKLTGNRIGNKIWIYSNGLLKTLQS